MYLYYISQSVGTQQFGLAITAEDMAAIVCEQYQHTEFTAAEVVDKLLSQGFVHCYGGGLILQAIFLDTKTTSGLVKALTTMGVRL